MREPQHTGDSPACHSHWWQMPAALQANNLSLLQMVMELVLEN